MKDKLFFLAMITSLSLRNLEKKEKICYKIIPHYILSLEVIILSLKMKWPSDAH
jgi:hypothetical protein